MSIKNTLLWGKTKSSGEVFALSSNGSESKRLKYFDLASRTFIDSTVSFPNTSSTLSCAADEQYIYIGGSSHINIIDIYSDTIVNNFDIHYKAHSIAVDENYIYTLDRDAIRCIVYDKLSFSVAYNFSTYDSLGVVKVDDLYVYITHGDGRKFTTIRKSNMTPFNWATSNGGISRRVSFDNNYVYITYRDDHVAILDKNTMTEIFRPDGGTYGITNDDLYVYIADSNSLYKMTKGLWSSTYRNELINLGYTVSTMEVVGDYILASGGGNSVLINKHSGIIETIYNNFEYGFRDICLLTNNQI